MRTDNLLLEEGEDWTATWTTTRKELESLRHPLDELRRLGVHVCVDIGVTVGERPHFSRQLRFAPMELDFLRQLGIELVVSAYPAEA